MATGARDRLVNGAARSLATRGLAASSFSDIVAESGAPRGSIYHYFPGGKDQLMGEAVEGAGTFLWSRLGNPGTPAEVVTAFFGAWRALLVHSDFAMGCAVAAVVVDGDPGLSDKAGATFRDWRTHLAELLTAAGYPAAGAPAFATLMMAAAEGAVILSRADRSLEPLDTVEASLRKQAGTGRAARGSARAASPR